MGSKKMGRPTDDPKTIDVKVRITESINEKLIEYCKKVGITRAEAIRQGINLLFEETGLSVSMCPWADGNFSKPFIEAFEEWVNGDAAVANHYRYLER